MEYLVIENAGKLEGGVEINLMMKVQLAGKEWDNAPKELKTLRHLLTKSGYQTSWNPQKLGINLLTANKIRGMVLKRILMKLYPFDSFWATESLDETLHKCMLVCSQLKLRSEQPLIWGQCSMDESYEFWKHLLQTSSKIIKYTNEDDSIQEAKSNVVSALIAARGTDWDKLIAKNFQESVQKNRSGSCLNLIEGKRNEQMKVKQKLGVGGAQFSDSWMRAFQDALEPKPQTELPTPPKLTTTTSLALELKQESYEMIESLKNVQKFYNNDCVLQIDKAFKLGYNVCDLADDFEAYMSANNRGAFRDVEAITNHTDRVVKAMSKLTTAFQDFSIEFRKYFKVGRGDETLS